MSPRTRKSDDDTPEQDAPEQDAPEQEGTDGVVPGTDVPAPTPEDLGQDVGYIGEKVDPRPNSAYSQETDPTSSPSAAEANLDAARARVEAQEAELR